MVDSGLQSMRKRVHDSFDQQRVMETLGATLTSVEAGEVVIELPYNAALTQQNGYLHAGIVATIVDSACGYAAYSLMSDTASVLTVEFKTNFCSPARGETFVAHGVVRKSGRTLMVANGEVHAVSTGEEEPRLVAMMQATMMALEPR